LDKHLHIICLNVPYPVNYGGVFDLFYKLPALQKLGIKIHLHCFEYGRGEQPELNKYCKEVHYYKRKTGLSGISLKLPYIVSSRANESLLERLTQDDHPILMEGVHCTYLLNDKRFTQRKCFVRLHNVEHIYYEFLLANSTSFFRKIYYWWESKLLRQYEQSIVSKATFFSVIENDAVVYRALGCKSISYLPLFLPPWKVASHPGKGTYCLYHGDLSVAENEKAAYWLLENVFSQVDVPFVIAGKNPPAALQHAVDKKSKACLVANPGHDEMQDMIARAHINIIPSFNATGIKLKLINALFNGRHCIVNTPTVEGTGLDKACHIANSALDMINLVTQFYAKEFSSQDIAVRQSLLENMFDNDSNASLLVEKIWK
jgi:hypothetical protein